MVIDEIIKDLSKSLINWYDFKTGSKVLFVSGGRPECEVLFDALREKEIEVVRAIADELNIISDVFDYIVAVGIIERSETPEKLLTRLKELINVSGKLLIGAENRLAVRYFCGDKDMFSGHVFDGIDDYAMVSDQRKKAIRGRAYARAEYKKMLISAGFNKCKFYSVLPDIIRPQILIAENYIPSESIDVRVFPQYNNPETIFLEEERLYETLMENHMFHQMANGFLIECSIEGELLDIDQVTIQGDRSHKEALATLIRHQKSVVKKALYPEGSYKVESMMESTKYLKQHGVPIVNAYVKDSLYVMPYINGQIATEYFRAILYRDRDLFLNELEVFREIILESSEHVPYEDINWRKFEPGWEKRRMDDPNIDQWYKCAFGTEEEKQNIGAILKRGYIDMVSINCFHTENGFLFFDQEFYIENFPVNAIFIRTIDFIYRNSPDMEKLYPREELLRYFKLYEHQNTWRTMGNIFLTKLRNDRELSEYHRLHRRNWRTIVSNRHRMNYSQEKYEKLFTNIFRGTESKKIYLFGSGSYSEKFIEQFGQYYDIAGIVDNNENRWGECLLGIKIFSPSILKKIDVPFKVFICIKFFEDVFLQLQDMEIKDISVYDPRLDYDRPLKHLSSQKVNSQEKMVHKKYHIGYVSGVFDLFHIGHLNILRCAKEQCDYLIVGVVSDEQVIKCKKTQPYIPFNERLEIVRACRYVDEAVMIPADRSNTEEAYYMYHFDVQFSGSDYANDPGWLSSKIFLQQHGSDMIFFPYTQTTSSTKIKEQISQYKKEKE